MSGVAPPTNDQPLPGRQLPLAKLVRYAIRWNDGSAGISCRSSDQDPRRNPWHRFQLGARTRDSRASSPAIATVSPAGDGFGLVPGNGQGDLLSDLLANVRLNGDPKWSRTRHPLASRLVLRVPELCTSSSMASWSCCSRLASTPSACEAATSCYCHRGDRHRIRARWRGRPGGEPSTLAVRHLQDWGLRGKPPARRPARSNHAQWCPRRGARGARGG